MSEFYSRILKVYYQLCFLKFFLAQLHCLVSISFCSFFRTIFNFFRDIFSLTKNPPVFGDCISLLVEHIRETHNDVEVIVGLDSRGFIFGVLIALRLNIPFVPLRKKGKLPGETLRLSYSLEYGNVSII